MTTLLTWGVGKPFLIEKAINKAKCKPVNKPFIVHKLTSDRLTVAICEFSRGVLLNAIRLDTFSYSDTEAKELARITLKNLKTGEVRVLTSAHDWEKVSVRRQEYDDASPSLSVYLANPRGIQLGVSVEIQAADTDTVIFRTKIINSDENWTVLSANYPEISFSNGDNLSFFRPVSSGVVEENVDKRQYP